MVQKCITTHKYSIIPINVREPLHWQPQDRGFKTDFKHKYYIMTIAQNGGCENQRTMSPMDENVGRPNPYTFSFPNLVSKNSGRVALLN